MGLRVRAPGFVGPPRRAAIAAGQSFPIARPTAQSIDEGSHVHDQASCAAGRDRRARRCRRDRLGKSRRCGMRRGNPGDSAMRQHEWPGRCVAGSIATTSCRGSARRHLPRCFAIALHCARRLAPSRWPGVWHRDSAEADMRRHPGRLGQRAAIGTIRSSDQALAPGPCEPTAAILRCASAAASILGLIEANLCRNVSHSTTLIAELPN